MGHEPKFSRTARKLLERRGSASGPTPSRESGVSWGELNDSEGGVPSSGTTATGTETKAVTLDAATPFVTNTIGLSQTPTESRWPDAASLLLSQYQTDQDVKLRPEHEIIFDKLAAGYSCSRARAVNRALQFLLTGNANWRDKTVDDALCFYVANFWLP